MLQELITEFHGHPTEFGWERAYLEALLAVTTQRGVEVVDAAAFRETTPTIALVMRVVHAREVVEQGAIKATVEADNARQCTERLPCLAITPCGPEHEAASQAMTDWIGGAPYGLVRWLLGIASEDELFLWIARVLDSCIDRLSSRQQSHTTAGRVESTLQEELPSNAREASSDNRYFPGMP